MLLFRSHWHFASEHDPERERRLLRVTNGEDDNNQDQSPEFGGSPQSGEEQEDIIESTRTESHDNVEDISLNFLDPEIAAVLKSPQAFEIAQEAGFIETNGTVPDSIEQERLLNAFIHEDGGTGRNAFRLAKELERQLDRNQELLEITENKMRLIFGAIRGEKIEISDGRRALSETSRKELERLSKSLSKIPQIDLERLQPVNRMEMEVDKATLITELKLTDYIHDGKELDEVSQILLNLLSSINKRRQLRLKKTTVDPRSNPDEPDAEANENWQTEEINTMNKNALALRIYLDKKLKSKARKQLKKNTIERNKILRSINGASETFNENEANKRALHLYGCSWQALEEMLFDADTPLYRILGEIPNEEPPKPEESRKFLRYAEEKMQSIQDIQKGYTENLVEASNNQRLAEQWACTVADEIKSIDLLPQNEKNEIYRILQIQGGEKLEELRKQVEAYTGITNDQEKIISIRFEPERVFLATDMPLEKRKFLLNLLRTARTQRTKLGKTIEKLPLLERDVEIEISPLRTIAAQCTETRSKLDGLLGEIITTDGNIVENGMLDHPASRTLRVGKHIRDFAGSIRANIDYAQNNNNVARLKTSINQMAQLEDAIDTLRMIITAPPKAASLEDGRKALYKSGEAAIFYLDGLSKEQKNLAVHHEYGHAILDVVMWKSGIAPFLLTDLCRRLERSFDDTGRPLKEILEATAVELGLAQQKAKIIAHAAEHHPNDPEAAKKEADELLFQELTEELVMNHATWVQQGRPQPKDSVAPLYEFLDRYNEGIPVATKRPMTANQRVELNRYMTASATEPGGTDEDPTDDDAETASAEQENKREELLGVQRSLQVISSFLNAYPQFDESSLLPKFRDEIKREWEYLDKQFVAQEDSTDEFRRRLTKLVEKAAHVDKVVKGFDKDFLDTTKEEREEQGILENVYFLSINDVIKLAKDTWEDITQINKRRQDRALKEVGELITDRIQIGKNIWGAGHYMHALKGYHTRRYAGAEEEAANKWKDGLKNEDSHTILHLFPTTQDRDQIRGMISLLSERGEMEWNDKGVMEALSELSGFQMPIEACLRDDVLRDTWYRKLVAVIWNDKELYYHWRGENDSKIDSGKKHFTTTVDQLSNVGGGMAGELEKQLRLWCEYEKLHHMGYKVSPPEDCKAHLYEEVIHYAIRNGKMSMEQKFYYLVRGVAEGLLSIDRLRALAGETGGVLNQFPFIDYFYGHNNTMPEVKALAARLQEEDPKNEFKPGTKTTLWLQLEVAREPSVQARINKGTSRTGAENIDHEDVPFFITSVDHTVVENLADIISGSRQKITPEGWKNAYVGYNSKFKVFSALIDAEEAGVDRFTQSDANNLIRTLGGYIVMDNILMKNSKGDGKRPSLSKFLLLSKPVSGASRKATMDYRNSMNVFLGQLLQNQEFRGLINMERMDGLTIEHMAPTTTDLERKMPPLTNAEGKVTDEKIREMVFKKAGTFVEALQDAINTPEGFRIFKELLRTYSKNFINEGGSETLNNKEIIEIQRKFQKEKFRKVEHVGHEHGHEGH